jgi:hypothetical protein
MGCDIDRAQHLPVCWVQGVQPVSGGKPDLLTVKRNPADAVDTRKRSIFAQDFGCRSFHGSIHSALE